MIITLICLSIIFFMCSGITRAVSNIISFHYDKSIFKNNPYWNPQLSWKNKWKNGDPNQGEKFLGSSTVFVMFTDPWHLFEFIHRIFFGSGYLIIGFLISKSLWYLFGILVGYGIFTIFFHIFFTYIFVRK